MTLHGGALGCTAPRGRAAAGHRAFVLARAPLPLLLLPLSTVATESPALKRCGVWGGKPQRAVALAVVCFTRLAEGAWCDSMRRHTVRLTMQPGDANHAPEGPPCSSRARVSFPARGCAWRRRSPPPGPRARSRLSQHSLARGATAPAGARWGASRSREGGMGGGVTSIVLRRRVRAAPHEPGRVRAFFLARTSTAYSSLLAGCIYSAFLAVSAPLLFIYGFSEGFALLGCEQWPGIVRAWCDFGEWAGLVIGLAHSRFARSSSAASWASATGIL